MWLQRLGYNTYYVGKVRGQICFKFKQAQVLGCLQHTTTSMTTTRTQGSKDVEGDGDASHIQLP